MFKVKVSATSANVGCGFDVLGLSFDVSSPCFQNLIFDAGVKIKIIDCINISSGWQFDVQACANEVQTWVPSIGISVKFNLDTGFTNKEKYL